MSAMPNGGGIGFGPVDFASAPGLAFAVAAPGAAGAHNGGLGNMKTSARFNPDSGCGKLVPAAKLRERDAEPVSNGD